MTEERATFLLELFKKGGISKEELQFFFTKGNTRSLLMDIASTKKGRFNELVWALQDSVLAEEEIAALIPISLEHLAGMSESQVYTLWHFELISPGSARQYIRACLGLAL